MSRDKDTLHEVTKVVMKEMIKMQTKKTNHHKDSRLRNTKLLVEN